MTERVVSMSWDEWNRAVAESSRALAAMVPDVGPNWIAETFTPEYRARVDAEFEVRQRYYEAPGYFWLGQYAEEDERLWPFCRD